MRKVLFLFVLGLSLCSGCVLTDVTRVTPADKIDIPDKPYVRLGKVQAESWGICLVYALPLAGSMESAKRSALRLASRQGADAVINAECYSETHMPLLMLFGWKENHFSGDAVKYTK